MNSRKKIIAFLIGAILITVSFIAVFNHPADSINANLADNNWVDGWNYRKSHDIQGSSGAGTGYQIKIVAHYGEGTDYGSNVYLNSQCQKTFADIRFTGSDGLAILDYWLETKVDGNYAVFWVKVNDNLDTQQTIYLYYGNQTAASASSIQKTFPFADDFSGSFDTAKWRTFGYGKLTAANGVCMLETVPGDWGWIYLMGRQQFGTNYAIRFSSSVIEQGDSVWTHHGLASIYSDQNKSSARIDEFPNYITASQESKYYAWDLKTRADGQTSRTDLSSDAPVAGQFNTYEIERNAAANVRLTCNDALQGTINADIPTVNMGAMFSADNDGSQAYSQTVIDWVLIRKYVADEPLQGAWGPQNLP